MDDDFQPPEERAAALFADPRWAERFPPLLSPDQAATFAGVPKATIYSWSSRGLLGAAKCRVGKYLRIDRIEFAKLIMKGAFANDRQS